MGGAGVIAVVVSFMGSGNCSTLDAGVVEAETVVALAERILALKVRFITDVTL